MLGTPEKKNNKRNERIARMRRTRRMTTGLTLVIAAVILAQWTGIRPQTAQAQALVQPQTPRAGDEVRPPAATSCEDLIVIPLEGDEKSQLLTVIDSKRRVMSVYRIDRASGKITLCSVRSINWDLQMTEFNGESPLPREIRSLIQPR